MRPGAKWPKGLLRHDAGNRFEVFSAGTKPGYVRPEVIAVMKELDIDISSHRSKSVEEFTLQPFDCVLKVWDNANESCPIFPGKAVVIHQSFEDPAAMQGSEEERHNLIRLHGVSPLPERPFRENLRFISGQNSLRTFAAMSTPS